jgi:predicted N-formylglutamate amidohydrolase
MQLLRQGLGMLLMTFKQLQTFLQQRFQLGVLRVGNKRFAQGLIDRLMIRHFVVDIGFVERYPIETSKLFALGVRCLRQALACWIIFRRDVQLFDEARA